jgi:hypothetical protein
MKRDSRTPLVAAIVLLLLPMLYEGSYFALVVPQGWAKQLPQEGPTTFTWKNYRVGSAGSEVLFGIVYWPLEKIDHSMRPSVWNSALKAEHKRLDAEWDAFCFGNTRAE